MQFKYDLPQEWIDHLVNEPETGMGYQEVDMYFTNETLTDVVVYNCSYFFHDNDSLNLDDLVDMDVHEGRHAWNQPVP